MIDLIKEITPWLLVVVGIIWLTGRLTNMWLARLEEKELPDEKDVIGKVLPVGSKFLKDGRVVEVISGTRCRKCVYYNETCSSKTAPQCYKKHNDGYDVYFKYVKQ